MAEVQDTLHEREGRYGNFLEGARSWRELQYALEKQPGWGRLMQDQQYAATMIMMKLARAMNGQPDDVDNWHDIQGYAKLIEDRILSRGIYAGVGDVPGAEPGSILSCTCGMLRDNPLAAGNPWVHHTGCPVRDAVEAGAARRSSGG